MSKKTLLQMVQNILSSMDSDEVNSISDTVESMQVAEIIQETYEDLVATLKVPERRSLVKLEGLADLTKPNYLRIPNNVKEVEWIRYNGDRIEYLTPEEFIHYTLEMAPLQNVVTVTDFSGIDYSVICSQDPKYTTSFDDQYVVFDAFNQQAESTLEGTNSIAYADMDNPFLLTDEFICDLDANWFPTLLAEAKNACFVNLKQANNANEQARGRRGIVRIQNELSRVSTGNPINRLPDYGRRR